MDQKKTILVETVITVDADDNSKCSLACKYLSELIKICGESESERYCKLPGTFDLTVYSGYDEKELPTRCQRCLSLEKKS